jgi:hypothetical protein
MRGSDPQINPFNGKDSTITSKSEHDSSYEDMIVDRSSKLVNKNKKPKRKAFGDKTDNRISVLSNTEEKPSQPELPKANTFNIIPEENEHEINILDMKPKKHKPSESKKKFFLDDD